MRPKSENILIIAVLLLTVLAYLPALNGEFISDEHGLIENRIPILEHPNGLRELITHDYWWATGDSGARNVLYRPWIGFTFWFDWKLGGGDPFLFHLSNILVHVGCVLLIILLVKPLTGLPVALLVGGLAGVAPVHASSVGWISGRTDLWATFFSLLFILLFTRSRQKNSFVWLMASCIVLMLGLGSKEVAIVAPLIAFLYWRTLPEAEKPARKTGLLSWLAVAAAIVTYLIVRTSVIGAASGNILNYIAINFPYLAEQYLRTAWHILFPTVYSFSYDAVWDVGFLSLLIVTVGWLAFLACIVLIAWGLLNKKVWAFGGAWYVISLVPVYGLGQNFAPLVDLYGYFGTGGLFLFVIDGARELMAKLGESWFRTKQSGYVMSGIVVMFAVVTFFRVPFMQSDLTMTEQTAKHRPKNVKILVATADAMLAEGWNEEALKYLERAHAADTTNAEPHKRIAHYFLDNNDIQAAAPHVDAVAALDPNKFDSQMLIGRFYYEGGRCDYALSTYENAFRKHEPDSSALYDYGLVMICLQRFRDAGSIYQEVLKRNPNWAGAWSNLAMCYENLGLPQDAINAYSDAAALDSTSLVAWEGLAINYHAVGDHEKASAAAQKFYALNPAPHRRERLEKLLSSEQAVTN